MEAKGSAVISIKEFIKKKHPEHSSDWHEGLLGDSKDIFSNIISASKWYPLEDGVVIPTRLVGDKFYAKNLKKAAWEMGRFSAEMGLTGMYKVFLLIAKPSYIMARAGKVFSAYYKPFKMELVDSADKYILLHMTDLATPSEIIEWRVGGWMEKAMEMCGCSGLEVEITKSLTKKDPLTEYKITWK